MPNSCSDYVLLQCFLNVFCVLQIRSETHQKMDLVKWLFTACMHVHIKSFISPFSRRKRKFLGGGADSSEEENFWRPGKKKKTRAEKTNRKFDTVHKSCSWIPGATNLAVVKINMNTSLAFQVRHVVSRPMHHRAAVIAAAQGGGRQDSEDPANP